MTHARGRSAPLTLALGGAIWSVWALLAVASGAVGDSTRLLTAASGFVLAAGLGGLVVALPWTYDFPGGEGAGLAALGALLFGIGQALAGLGDTGLSVWFVAPGVLALVGGSTLLAVGLVRARRTPPWIGVSLLVGSVTFLGFNSLSALAIPFGLAWVAFGGYLARYPERPTEHLEPSALVR